MSEPKSTKNLSKNGIQDGMHLGIDFSMIVLDFGGQVGFKNPPKIGVAGLARRLGEASWLVHEVRVEMDDMWREDISC